MFFCIRDIHDGRPVGVNPKGREPLAYKVENQKLFRKAINELLKEIDEGKFEQDPIAWNLYRKLNGYEINYNGYGNNIFSTRGDYRVIDDYSTDVDSIKDIEKIENFLKILKGEVKMIKVGVIEEFTLGRFNEITNLKRAREVDEKATGNRLMVGDTFECQKDLADYLLGDNPIKRPVVKVIEIIPEKVVEPKVEVKEVKTEAKKPATRRKTTTRRKKE